MLTDQFYRQAHLPWTPLSDDNAAICHAHRLGYWFDQYAQSPLLSVFDATQFRWLPHLLKPKLTPPDAVYYRSLLYLSYRSNDLLKSLHCQKCLHMTRVYWKGSPINYLSCIKSSTQASIDSLARNIRDLTVPTGQSITAAISS